jgi:hypothetical protein
MANKTQSYMRNKVYFYAPQSIIFQRFHEILLLLVFMVYDRQQCQKFAMIKRTDSPSKN